MAKFSDWNEGRNRYKDFVRGAVDLNDFEELVVVSSTLTARTQAIVNS